MKLFQAWIPLISLSLYHPAQVSSAFTSPQIVLDDSETHGLPINASLVVSGCSSPSVPWTPCPSLPYYGPTIKCATIPVPLDYSAPSGPHVNIGLVCLPATNAPKRKGTIVYLPGGPGNTAAGIVIDAETGANHNQYFDHSKEFYDIVGIDPRGLGRSHPIKCQPADWNSDVTYFPANVGEFNKLVGHYAAVGPKCAAETGPADLISTTNTLTIVHDIEHVRTLLNEPQLTLYGDSYGTFTALTYLEEHAATTRALILDAVVDHTVDTAVRLPRAAAAVEAAFGAWVSWCATSPDCAWRSPEKDIVARFEKLIAVANTSPFLPAPDCLVSLACKSPVSGYDLLLSLQGTLSARAGSDAWKALAARLNAAEHARVADAALALPWAVDDEDSAFTTQTMLCHDFDHGGAGTMFAAVAALIAQAAAAAPHTRGAGIESVVQTACVGWPFGTTFPPRLLRAPPRGHVPPVIFVNAQIDAGTPLAGAENVFRQFGGDANVVFLTRQGVGHGTYRDGSGVIHGLVENFLVKDVLPATGVYKS
ncbi:Alpha/Beta hydrolase protein [Lasiosphaeria miniovina]|uniref:Alpha/Beta hydrolase protein n=1 Tax=Lasiosphaeria miniovina TaxID=1954250 RepID=A0AA40AD67_9PEZI|nr:Alpha/Beta hydrolase protein [Lasiosphaeria miniovina]KAK0713635.1 Alpha/Beta hydrolase protein [Lasiosphaeria miniovina]